MYYIYYWGNVFNTKGYIGQGHDTSDNFNRLREHFQAAIHMKDGGRITDGTVNVTQQGLSNLKITIYPEHEGDEYYGIPQKVYEDFFKVWSYSGCTSFEQVVAKPDLLIDLAEMFHITHACMNGKNWARYNKLGGGFQSNNATSLVLLQDTPANNYGMHQGTYQLTRFQLRLQDFRDDSKVYDAWKRLVNPKAYLNIKDVLTNWYTSEAIWQDLASDYRFQRWFNSQLMDFVKLIAVPKNQRDKAFKDKIRIFNKEFINFMTKSFNDPSSTLRQTMKRSINQRLNAIGIKSNISYKINDVQAEDMLKPIFNRIENLSANMWSMLIDELVSKLSADFLNTGITTKNVKVVGGSLSNILHRFTSKGIGSQTVSTIKMPADQALNFEIKKEGLPEWAVRLQALKLGPDRENTNQQTKHTIRLLAAREICNYFFDRMNSFTLLNPLNQGANGTLIGLDYTQWLLARIKEIPLLKVSKTGNDSNIFFHAILSLWHQTKFPIWETVVRKDKTYIFNPAYQQHERGPWSYMGTDPTWTSIRDKYNGQLIDLDTAANELVRYLPIKVL